MSSYIIPDSITPRPIKPGVVTVETIEAIMADRPCAILPVAGDCLEGVDVVDGGWQWISPGGPRLPGTGARAATEAPISVSAMPRSPERLALRSCIRSIMAYGAPGRW